MNWLVRLWGGRKAEAVAPSPPQAAKKAPDYDRAIVESGIAARSRVTAQDLFRPPELPPGVAPKMALDSFPAATGAWAAGTFGLPAYGGYGFNNFLGYPLLSELSQRAEYFTICDTLAKDLTRKWGEFKTTSNDEDKAGGSAKGSAAPDPFDKLIPAFAKDEADPFAQLIPGNEIGADPFDQLIPGNENDAGNGADPFLQLVPGGIVKSPKDDKSDKLRAIEAEFKRLKVRQIFHEAAVKDGYFGRVQVFIDLGTNLDDPNDELATPIGDGTDETSKQKIAKGSLKRLQLVEPLWTYPYNYDAKNPLSPYWYRPQIWYVMGRQVHTSRLFTFTSRPVPDLLKPAYNFGGLSLIQIARPYVDKWWTTASSIASLVQSFVTGVLATQMQDSLNGTGGTGLVSRVALFQATRNNQGVLAIDKDSEDYKIAAAPLGGLSELQSQALEHISTVSRIPSVKWTGNEPAGLNASSEGTIRVYNDYIHSLQESFFGTHMAKLLAIVQLSLFGEVDPEIEFEFLPLEEESESDKAELRKLEAETDQILVDSGALSPQDVRERVANDADGPYEGIDPSDMPDLLQEEEQGLEPKGGRPQAPELAAGGGMPQGGGGDPFQKLVQ